MVAGMTFPLAWGLVFSGTIRISSSLNPLQWHAHEMIFAFGWAVLGGFLLTASKNWVKIRGLHGFYLMVPVGFWIAERLTILKWGLVPQTALHFALLNICVVWISLYVIWSLIKFRATDSFKDNFFFIALLSTLLVAKNFLLTETLWAWGFSLAIGLFRLAFTVMFERTMTQFMKSTEGVHLYRNTTLDYAIKGLVLASVFQVFMPPNLRALVLSAAGLLLLIRWLLWQPLKGFKRFGNATMYLGYLGLIIHFFLEALSTLGLAPGLGAISLHTFTFLTMGIVIPSMLVRIAQGHTGRPPQFTRWDQVAISIIGISSIFRLILTSAIPEYYAQWITLSGVFWAIGFFLLFFRLTPFLLSPRIDGKTH